MQSRTYAFHHTLTEIRREGTGGYGGGGGWVGGMITFSTTYIMPLYHHHHIITVISSRNHHAIIMQSRTYAFHIISSYVDRDTPGVGGGDNNMYTRMWQWRHWHPLALKSACFIADFDKQSFVKETQRVRHCKQKNKTVTFWAAETHTKHNFP